MIFMNRIRVVFFAKDYDVSTWDTIPVPLPWQMAGYGQLYYFNCDLPMLWDPRNLLSGDEKGTGGKAVMDLLDPKTPFRERQMNAAKDCFVPTAWNPVGSYATEFTVPENWKGQRVVMHFSGVKIAFTCWVNGKEVGYSQDSFTPAEFDISHYLTPGETGWPCRSCAGVTRGAYSSKSQLRSPKEDTLVTTMAGDMSWHSEEEKAPWVMIDLEKEQAVIGVEIINRQSKYYGRGSNLHVWLSGDGKSWKQVFKGGPAQSRWLVEMKKPELARYIKIGLINDQPLLFNLKGVNVFSK